MATKNKKGQPPEPPKVPVVKGQGAKEEAPKNVNSPKNADDPPKVPAVKGQGAKEDPPISKPHKKADEPSKAPAVKGQGAKEEPPISKPHKKEDDSKEEKAEKKNKDAEKKKQDIEKKKQEKKEEKDKKEFLGEDEVAKKDFLRTVFDTFSKVWSTRDLQETHNFDRNVFLRTYLLEFIIFIAFLIVVIILMIGLRPINAFYVCNAVKRTFFETPLVAGKHMLTFKNLATKQQFLQYMQTNFLDGMFGVSSSNQSSNHWILEQNILIGETRIRQVRVRNDSCELPDNVKSKISSCFGPYNSANEDFQTLSTTIGKTYIDESKASVMKYYGILNTYTTSGYIVYISKTKQEAAEQLKLLDDENWINRGTRAVLVDFVLYNPSIDTFAVTSMAAEFSMTGGVFTSFQILTIRFLQFTYGSITFYILFVFFGFICYYIFEEIVELIVLREHYYRNISSYLDNIIILTGTCLLIVMAIAITRHNSISEEMLESQDYHNNMLYVASMQTIADGFLALHVFFVFVKLFKYLEVNQTMHKLTRTLYESSGDLIGYSILFFFVILSFALLGMLLFGYQLSIFSSLKNSVVTLFRILLGDIEFEYIDDKHSIIGAAYLILFIITIYFILMNVFLAIIFESYSKVKEAISKRPFDFYLVDYLKNKFRKSKKGSVVKKKCSLWVTDMLNEGYADKSIEVVLKNHKKQGLKLDTLLNEHQVLTLTHELEEIISEGFTYENISQLEQSFKNLHENLQVVINNLVKRQNTHKLSMVKLLDMIKKSKEPNDIKITSIYNLVKNELAT